MHPPDSDWEIADRVFAAHPGGEAGFWVDWKRDRLAPEVMDWFHRHGDDILLGIEVDDANEVRRQRRIARDAAAVAVETSGTITAVAVAGDPVEILEQRGRFAEALFDILEHDLDIDPSSWAGPLEIEVGTDLVRAAFSEFAPPGEREPPPSFFEIARWLVQVRQGDPGRVLAESDEADLRALVAPMLIPAADGIGYRAEPSFRSFIRLRLLQYCRKMGWEPRSEGRFHDLDAAFAALSRTRIGAAFQGRYSMTDAWLAVGHALA